MLNLFNSKYFSCYSEFRDVWLFRKQRDNVTLYVMVCKTVRANETVVQTVVQCISKEYSRAKKHVLIVISDAHRFEIMKTIVIPFSIKNIADDCIKCKTKCFIYTKIPITIISQFEQVILNNISHLWSD